MRSPTLQTPCGLLIMESIFIRDFNLETEITPLVLYGRGDAFDEKFDQWKLITPSLDNGYSMGRLCLSMKAKDIPTIPSLCNEILKTHRIFLNDSSQITLAIGETYSKEQKEKHLWTSLQRLEESGTNPRQLFSTGILCSGYVTEYEPLKKWIKAHPDSDGDITEFRTWDQLLQSLQN